MTQVEWPVRDRATAGNRSEWRAGRSPGAIISPDATAGGDRHARGARASGTRERRGTPRRAVARARAQGRRLPSPDPDILVPTELGAGARLARPPVPRG